MSEVGDFRNGVVWRGANTFRAVIGCLKVLGGTGPGWGGRCLWTVGSLSDGQDGMVSVKFTIYGAPLLFPNRPTGRHGLQLHSSAESVVVEEKVEEQQQKSERRRKLFVLNLPWSYSVDDIKKVFGECGDVVDVEIIKQKDGKNRGFAFVTMSSAEGAQAAIEKFDSFELVGRIIKVQYAKRFKRPIRTIPPVTPEPQGEIRHWLYVSNLPWKARSNNLREFFSSNFNPVSARVIFDNPSGRSAGYGFVAFATKEEAESAISALDGKELMGRPIRLKLSERKSDALESKEEESNEQQRDDSEIREEESKEQLE